MKTAYFQRHYIDLRYPIAESENIGLRNPQVGALHAVSSHFTLSDEPALVVMPTGSGKSAVLMMLPFILRSRRCLIITPSILVRDQLAEDFRLLSTLRSIGVVAPDFPNPRLVEITRKVATPAEWRALRKADVAIGLPNSISPIVHGIPTPPADLFDLLLVDEAHHGRAPTWESIMAAFPKAKEVHFTATPFRRDEKPLRPKIAYSYPLSDAVKDGIFGKISYIAPDSTAASTDISIAIQAAKVFARDRNEGHEHLIMVRTDSKTRAKELSDVYASETDLNLAVVHSGLGSRTIKKTIKELRAGTLDGVVCVDMLGEGFDLPQLKIAAVHSPHKSLAVTLQFVGRFARTASSARIGDATFIAVPAEFEIAQERLFTENAAWQEIITNLADSRIEAERQVREALATFEQAVELQPEFRDVSLQAFWPFNHFKIYLVRDSVSSLDLSTAIKFPKQVEVVYHEVSDELSAAVLVTRQNTLPRWTDLPQFASTEFSIFVIYYDGDTRLLFIHSSAPSTAVYELIAESYTGGLHRRVPMSKINSVLATLTALEVYNVGMRRRALHPNAESYRIGAGANMQNAVSPLDGSMYYRGHVFLAGQNSEGLRENIGYSSSSKVWRNEYTLIPNLVSWARTLAARIKKYKNVKTGSALDYLGVGQEITRLPDDMMAIDWPADVYMHPRRIRKESDTIATPLLDHDLVLDVDASGSGAALFSITSSSSHIDVQYTLTAAGNLFVGPEIADFVVEIGSRSIPLSDYLSENPPRLFLPDFSVIDDGQIYEPPTDLPDFERSRIKALGWADAGVNIKKEFDVKGDKRTGRSVHEYLQELLRESPAQIVFYDHGSGEMADFVTFQIADEGVHVSFVHCKGSKGNEPGSRVGDAYEVASQVVKSVIWLRGADALIQRVRHRAQSLANTRFVKGEITALKEVVSAMRRGVTYEMILVQPGVSQSKLKPNVATVLAAADSFVVDHQCLPLRIWGSD